jgi:hypothetical protein
MSNSGRRPRLPPLSVRLSASEREALTARAGGLALSTYVKAVVLGSEAKALRRGPRPASVDRELAARLLAALGASRLASNMAQIARHANLGNLFFDENTKNDIRQACADIAAMRTMLMRALGKEVSENDEKSVSTVFGRTAAFPGGGA